MADVTKFIDLTDKEERKAFQVKKHCQNIINIIDTISLDKQDGQILIKKINNILLEMENLRSYYSQINNLKRIVKEQLNQ